jgi:hypothetical protein
MSQIAFSVPTSKINGFDMTLYKKNPGSQTYLSDDGSKPSCKLLDDLLLKITDFSV